MILCESILIKKTTLKLLILTFESSLSGLFETAL